MSECASVCVYDGTRERERDRIVVDYLFTSEVHKCVVVKNGGKRERYLPPSRHKEVVVSFNMASSSLSSSLLLWKVCQYVGIAIPRKLMTTPRRLMD